MTSILGDERLTETTDIGMVEGLQNADLPREVLQLPGVIANGVIVVVVICRRRRISRAKFLGMDDLDGPPLARGARHGLHDGSERAPSELVRHIVERVDAGELERREVPIDVPIVFLRVLLLHRRAERDFVSVAQDARLSPDHACAVNLFVYVEGANKARAGAGLERQ